MTQAARWGDPRGLEGEVVEAPGGPHPIAGPGGEALGGDGVDHLAEEQEPEIAVPTHGVGGLGGRHLPQQVEEGGAAARITGRGGGVVG